MIKMVKVHTRIKRRLRIFNNIGGNKTKHVPRSKSFKTEDAANAYAKANGIAKYTLVDSKAASPKSSKIKIVVEE